ncbi:uncharacterized protein PV06_10724 [Exophiala oligosperma]|uniref:Uncharacterized protein n=1 Tax=Exophiala oligosperma TaxID=215243 RepID=A0A0D2BI54_9EURO|nr:uncharacterized protein PV06_10724 [Exophiala oligosperma]KIW37097.1 hypothetical protein PV06_10724 [Exophiala oligosperma]
MGQPGNSSQYSVPHEARKVLEEGIFANTSISHILPTEAKNFAACVRFVGSDKPSIPINWRLAESAAALKGLEACLVATLLKTKYHVDISNATINTDHAQLLIMSTVVWSVQPSDGRGEGHSFSLIEYAKELFRYIPHYDFHRSAGSCHRAAATNIYKTADGRYFHVHGSMNPDPTLDYLGLPHDMPAASLQDAWPPYVKRVSELSSREIQDMADANRQAGVTCQSFDSYRASEHGKANSHVGLFEIKDCHNSLQPPCWWPDSPQTCAQRPLAGLKVVDLSRIIAAPAVTRGLAELGASVVRVTSPHLPDMSALHIDLNWGKWNCSIDIKSEEERKLLRDLILEADVVVQGYRPHSLDKYGFGQKDIVDMCFKRPRGILSVRENCYGWYGPRSIRSGWQQISDASVGISWGYGRAMGLEQDEPVTPVFPNSDYMTGIAGVSAILTALIRRGRQGGSYEIDLALNYYNQWLASTVGEYPDDVWKEVWARHGKPVFRSYHNMEYTIPRMLQTLKQNSGRVLFNPEFFEENKVSLGYNIGTRGNGKDAAKWPQDLMTEVIV